jgi:GT2 family glycosyltransferase
MSSSLAVIICTFRREEVLVRTIEQVLAQNPPADEVAVIDQTPEHFPETQRFLEEMSTAGRIKWVRQEKPNLCVARNRGVLETTSALVHYLDDDVDLPAGLFAAHRQLHETPGIAGVTQDISTAPGWDRRYIDGKIDPADPALKQARRIDYFRGYNFSVKREAYIETSGFDEQFEGAVYRDEGDFAYRLQARGHGIATAPAANVVHLLSPSGGCRIPGNPSHQEWTKSLGFFIYGFRHQRLRHEIVPSLRAGPLRRENVVHPTRWPMAWIHYLRGFYRGWVRGRHPVVSPFADRTNIAGGGR